MQNRFACSVLALGVATLLAACGGGGADAGAPGS